MQHRDAAAAGQVDVEQHHVRLRGQDHLDRARGVGGLADDGHRAAELGADAGAEHRVVVDEHDAGLPAGGRRKRVGAGAGPAARGRVLR